MKLTPNNLFSFQLLLDILLSEQLYILVHKTYKNVGHITTMIL